MLINNWNVPFPLNSKWFHWPVLLLAGPVATFPCGWNVPVGLNSLLLLGCSHRGVTGHLVSQSVLTIHNHSVQNPASFNLCLESLQNFCFAHSSISYPPTGNLNQWSRSKLIYFLSLSFFWVFCLFGWFVCLGFFSLCVCLFVYLLFFCWLVGFFFLPRFQKRWSRNWIKTWSILSWSQEFESLSMLPI